MPLTSIEPRRLYRQIAEQIREHAAVLEAIRSHDPDKARVAMHHHMEQASKRFSRSWDIGDDDAR
jgi:DNA-binding GntR family transcriptional regulator